MILSKEKVSETYHLLLIEQLTFASRGEEIQMSAKHSWTRALAIFYCNAGAIKIKAPQLWEKRSVSEQSSKWVQHNRFLLGGSILFPLLLVILQRWNNFLSNLKKKKTIFFSVSGEGYIAWHLVQHSFAQYAVAHDSHLFDISWHLVQHLHNAHNLGTMESFRGGCLRQLSHQDGCISLPFIGNYRHNWATNRIASDFYFLRKKNFHFLANHWNLAYFTFSLRTE